MSVFGLALFLRVSLSLLRVVSLRGHTSFLVRASSPVHDHSSPTSPTSRTDDRRRDPVEYSRHCLWSDPVLRL